MKTTKTKKYTPTEAHRIVMDNAMYFKEREKNRYAKSITREVV